MLAADRALNVTGTNRGQKRNPHTHDRSHHPQSAGATADADATAA